MFSSQIGLIFGLCLMTNAEVKRDVGYNNLGYHSSRNNGGPSSLDISLHNEYQRKSKSEISNESKGLTSYASVGGATNNEGFGRASSLNNNPGRSTKFDHGWVGRDFNYNPIKYGQTRSTFVVPTAKTLFTPSEITPTNGGYHNPSFLTPAVAQDVTFGLNFLPTRSGLLGDGLGIIPLTHGSSTVNTDSGHFQGSYGGIQQPVGYSNVILPHLDGPNFHYGQNSFGYDPGFNVAPSDVYNTAVERYSNVGQNNGNFDKNGGNGLGGHPTTLINNNHPTKSVGYFHQGTDHQPVGTSNFGADYSQNSNAYSTGINLPNYLNPPLNENIPETHLEENHSGDMSHDFGGSSQVSSSGEQNYGGDEGYSSGYNSGYSSQNSQGNGGNTGEEDSSHVTNGHAVGHSQNNEKATSFQSFIIHSYKPQRVYAKKSPTHRHSVAREYQDKQSGSLANSQAHHENN